MSGVASDGSNVVTIAIILVTASIWNVQWVLN